MSDINWFTVVLGVVVMGGILISLMTPRTKKPRDPRPVSTPAKVVPKASEMNLYTMEEISKHNSRQSCWIIVDGSVYDVTSYIDEHPGGDAILNNAGGDATVGVKGPQHPPSMWDVLALYKIGSVKK